MVTIETKSSHAPLETQAMARTPLIKKSATNPLIILCALAALGLSLTLCPFGSENSRPHPIVPLNPPKDLTPQGMTFSEAEVISKAVIGLPEVQKLFSDSEKFKDVCHHAGEIGGSTTIQLGNDQIRALCPPKTLALLELKSGLVCSTNPVTNAVEGHKQVLATLKCGDTSISIGDLSPQHFKLNPGIQALPANPKHQADHSI